MKLDQSLSLEIREHRAIAWRVWTMYPSLIYDDRSLHEVGVYLRSKKQKQKQKKLKIRTRIMNAGETDAKTFENRLL